MISNVLYLNNGNGKFTEVANAGGASGNIGAAIADHAGTSESVVAADYDLDGYLDLLVTNGNNMRPLTLSGPKNLFHNLGGTNGWIEFDLVGTTSNRDGIGSKVYITSGGVTQYREQNGSSTVYSGLSANCVYQLKQDGTTVMLKGGLDSDTDGEGLTDGAEVKDGDGLIDGQEAGAGGYGTNPLNPDQRWRRCQ